MLDQQFTVNPDYYEFVNKNVVPLRLHNSDEGYKETAKRYSVEQTPTVIVTESDGKEIDRIVRYKNPPSIFLFYLKQAQKRIDTPEQLRAQYDKDKSDYASALKLASKYENSLKEEESNLAEKIYEDAIKNSDETKKLKFSYLDTGDSVGVYEYALYRYGAVTLKLDNWLTLIKEYPDSRLIPNMFPFLFHSGFIGIFNTDEKKEFFDTLLKRYPNNYDLLYNFVQFSAQTGWKKAEAAQTAIKINDDLEWLIANYDLLFSYQANLLKSFGDEASAERIYGTVFLDSKIQKLVFDFERYISYWLKQGGNEEGIKKAIETASRLDTDGQNMSFIADPFARAGQTEKALEFFGPDYIAKHQDNPKTLNYYIDFWTSQKTNLESALAAVQRSMELQPSANLTGKIQMLQQTAQIYLLMNKETEASTVYGKEYIQSSEPQVYSLNKYIDFWTKEGKNLESALWAAQKLVETESDAYNWDKVATVYIKMGNLQKALEAEQKAVELAGDRADIFADIFKKRLEQIKADIKKKKN